MLGCSKPAESVAKEGTWEGGFTACCEGSCAEAGVLGERGKAGQGWSQLTPAPICGLRPFQGAGRGTDVPIVRLGSLLGKLQQLRSSSCLLSFSF